MLTIEIPPIELFDSKENRFIDVKAKSITLEHSLISLSKWESKWEKPFLSSDPKNKKSSEEMLSYIECMTITPNVSPTTYLALSEKNIESINEYINSPRSATTFGGTNKKPSFNRETITSELIYYWMVACQIPMECERWHLNRLLTLIKICQIKNEPPKKMSRSEIYARNKALNEARRAKHGSRG